MVAKLFAVLLVALQAAPQSRANVLFFVTSDCPLSNFYASEIQELCAALAPKGIACSLVYEDVTIDDGAVRKHMADYGYKSIPFVIDRDRSVARRAGASVTPQAVVVGPGGDVRYRGRIDNRYEALGKPRRVVTERDLRDALIAVADGKPVARPETVALGCYIVSPDVLRKLP